MCGFTGGGLVKYSRHNYCAEFSLTAHSGGRVVKVGYNTGNKYIFSPTINVRNSALCNLLCVYFSIGNPQVGKKNKQNNNLLIIKNFSKSQTHHKQQLQKHWTLLRFFFSIKYLFCVGLFSNPSGQKIIKTTERRIQTEWNIFYLFHVYLFAHKWDSESSQITRHFL